MLRSLIEKSTFHPDDIDALDGAFRCVLDALGIQDSKSPRAEIVARLVIAAASQGLRDPIVICRRIVTEMKTSS
jgi:hypothetical protein